MTCDINGMGGNSMLEMLRLLGELWVLMMIGWWLLYAVSSGSI
jgi:hypothetical protein